MGCLEIEYYDVGKVRAVFVLSTKYKELLVLPETSSVTYVRHQYKQGALVEVSSLPMRTPGMSP